MATARADTYSIASGAGLRAGRAGPPAWLGAVGEWATLPNSLPGASGAMWPGTGLGGGANLWQALFTPWCGGILNTVGIYRSGVFVPGTFLVVFGGGHGDYGGNEVIAYGPIDSSNPTWSRITDPTVPPADDVGRLGGYPVSRHTYDTLVYLPESNEMMCIGAPGYYHTGNAFNQSDVFAFNTNPGAANPWSTRDTGFPAYNGGGTGAIDLNSGYNPVTRKAWGIGKGNGTRLGVWDVATATWSSYAKDNASAAANSKAAIDTAHNLLVMLSTTGAVLVQDLANPTSTLYSPTVTGSGPAAGNSTLEWDAVGGRFVSWARTGKTLYFLTPGANPASGGDAWTWTSTTPSGGATPANALTNGTFGRFRMATLSNGVRGVLLCSTYASAITFYRMS